MKFPSGAEYGLADQLMRAVNSIGANVAEGSAQATPAAKVNFYHHGLSSTSETTHHLKEAFDARLIAPKRYTRIDELASVVSKLIAGLIRKTAA